MKNAYLGIDIGSISTKGVIIDDNNNFLASEYIWTEGNPIEAVRRLLELLEAKFDKDRYQVVSVGTTGSARRLIGAVVGASMIKNEITAHAVGTTTLHPDVRTIFEIGGQDSKIILLENGVVVDYAMNTLCAAGTGSFLSSQSHRLGGDGDLVALKAVGIAPAVVALMVPAADLVGVPHQRLALGHRQILQHGGSHGGVGLHHLEFLVGEPSRLI